MLPRFIPTAHTAFKTRFGKASSQLISDGLTWYIPIVEKLHIVSNKVQKIDFEATIKTKDDVMTELDVSVQFQIKPENTRTAFYSLDDPYGQMNGYIGNVIRSECPKMILDDIFESHNDIGKSVKDSLDEKLSKHGYSIIDTLITDIRPDPSVVHAMNEVNASERMLKASVKKAEASYIEKVKDAEADKERKIRQGEGLAGMKKAIMEGNKEGMREMMTEYGVTNMNASAKDVMQFVYDVQRLDMLETIGKTDNTKVIYLDHGRKDVRDDVMQANDAQIA